jgi:crotonobetainyl-CoA:carnitine CoA-transferase CaiB-like acyl-CoA transferase
LEGLLARSSASYWSAALVAAGVPAGVVNDIPGAFHLAGELGLEPVVSVKRADGSTVALTRNPIGMTATPPEYRSAPPTLPRRDS